MQTTRNGVTYIVRSYQLVTSGKNFGKTLYTLVSCENGRVFMALCKYGNLDRAKLSPSGCQ